MSRSPSYESFQLALHGAAIRTRLSFMISFAKKLRFGGPNNKARKRC